MKKALIEGSQALHPELKKLRAFIDGGSRGNPGKAGAGVVIYDEKGKVLEEKSVYLGETTNNVAEYRALLIALQMAEQRGAEELKVFADSELVVKQMNGQYRVKNPALSKLFAEARRGINNFKRFEITHIPRKKNSEADRLANMAMDMASE